MAVVQNPIRALEVLVADDNQLIRGLLVDIIKLSGAKVTAAVDGEDAIEKYTARTNAAKSETMVMPYDLVITDLIMPKKTGIDVAKKVIELHPKTPVYIATGLDTDPKYNVTLAEAERLVGQSRIIKKPYGIDVIEGVLEQVKRGLANGGSLADYQQR